MNENEHQTVHEKMICSATAISTGFQYCAYEDRLIFVRQTNVKKVVLRRASLGTDFCVSPLGRVTFRHEDDDIIMMS